MAWGIYLLQGGFTENVTLVARYRLLCDMFTVPGVFLLLAAALVFVSNEEFFTIFSYAFSYAFRSLIPGALAGQKHERYSDYVERKREKGKIKGYSFLSFTGLAFLAIGLVFMFLFYRIYR